jgi:thiol-disulfide isomerase/thioredoxin
MELTKEQLVEKINSGEKMVVDFYSTTCGPCRMLKPMYEKLAGELKEQNSDVSLYTFNVQNDVNYAVNEVGVRGVPTIKSYLNSKENETIVGLPSLVELEGLVSGLK